MKKIISALTVSTALVAVPAFAALFEDWDTNEDGMLSQEEFTPNQDAGWFSEWNTNDDDVLSQDEFETGLFGLFDDDDNDELTQSEWDEGIDSWFGEQAVDAEFSAWDADGNGVLNEEEFTSEIGTLDTFEESYAEFAGDDAEVAEDEFDEGLFGWFDEDDDQALAEDEAEPLFGLLD